MNASSSAGLAILGASPAFKAPIPVGQLNFPPWEDVESSFRDIFSRQYYTNQGPLTEELESRLEDFLNVKHAIVMTNATIGLIVAAKALGLRGKVICPAFTFAATAQSLAWAGLKPLFCDVDPNTHQMSAALVAELINDDVSAILGVHLWGNSCNPAALERLAREHKVHLYFDAAHAFGCSFSGIMAGNFGELEVFSFHATKILNATEGGCVCTNDNALAAKIRNIRSSYGAGKLIDIPLTGNGRMSEAQAAMALLSLKNYPQIKQRNEANFRLYEELVADIAGIQLVQPNENSISNYQYIVLEVSEKEFGLSRDLLLDVLRAENIQARKYFSPGLHRTVPFCNDLSENQHTLKVTDQLCSKVLQLPSGQGITEESITKICEIIMLAKSKAHELLQL